MSADTPLIETRQLARRYGAQTVFENVSLQVARGEFVAIVGESGVGKSTLLNCLAALDTWDAGQVLFDGTTSRRWTTPRARSGGARTWASCSRRFMCCPI